jgi:hypothetical protein
MISIPESTENDVLVEVQEAHFRDWGLVQYALALLPTHQQMREFAGSTNHHSNW